MPRTWRYLERNLEDPALAGLKAWFDRHVPAGARA
jgi:aminoglycoside/choline kinase family phosphotransferase